MTVTMTDFHFDPTTLTLKKGVPVKLTVINKGAKRHDFSIVGDWSMESDVLEPGAQQVLTFTPGKAGTFQIVCSQVGHKAAGMVATVTVTD
jgi:uncharacterized cupredoxin-like copper-binding protein